MTSIPLYRFFKKKYGKELLIDVVELSYVKKYFTDGNTIHKLNYYDITIITDGEGFFRVNEDTQTVRSSDVIFTPPGAIRRWDTEHIRNGYALIFDEEFLLSFFNDPDFIRNLTYFRPDNRHHIFQSCETTFIQRIRGLVHAIKEEIDMEAAKDHHMLRAYLYEALMLLNREFKNKIHDPSFVSTKTTGGNYINRFIELVNNNFHIEQSTKYYSDLLCITPNYLNEIVKKELGINAKKYIRNRVLSEAKKKLLYTSVPVSVIAEELRYDSVSYFIRSFRQSTGYTPLEYRKITKP